MSGCRFVLGSLVLTSLFYSARSGADLEVYPSRVVLTEADHAAQISVKQKGLRALRCRIDAVFYRMSVDGSMTPIRDPNPGDRSAVSDFLFSPRQMTLEPGVEQVVRVLLHLPPELPEGDYYAYLNFEGIEEDSTPAPPTPAASAAPVPNVTSSPAPAPAPTPVSTSSPALIKSGSSLAIPVLVRKGKVEVKVELKDLTMIRNADGSKSYRASLVKSGNGFVYGDLITSFIPAGSDKPRELDRSSGVSSYIERRDFTGRINIKDEEKGALKVELKDPIAGGGKVITSATIPVN